MNYKETRFVEKYEPHREAVVELKNGRFVDVQNGSFFDPTARVMIKGTTIAAMPGVEDEPAGMVPDYTIDLQGRVAIPGLFNTHCHVSVAGHMPLPSLKGMYLEKQHGKKQVDKSLSECLVHGVTNIRDAAIADVSITADLNSRIAKGEITGPRIVQAVGVGPSGGYLAEFASSIPRIVRRVLGMWVGDNDDERSGIVEFPVNAGESQVRAAVDRAIDERGAQAIKVGEQSAHPVTRKPLTMATMDQFRVLVDQARKRGLQTLMHCVEVDAFRRGIEAGVSSLSHIPGDSTLTPEDAIALIESDCIIEPTVSLSYGLAWKTPSESSQDDPYLDRLSDFRAHSVTFADIAEEFFIPELQGSITDFYTRYSQGRFKMLGVLDATTTIREIANIGSRFVSNIGGLYRSGATVALANDGGIAAPCTPPMIGLELSLLDLFLNQEPDEMIFGGADALRIATINSARSMGLDERFGTLESGKIADIAIVDGNPFDDLQVIGSRVAALFVDGRMVINNCGLEVEPVRTA